MINRNKLEHILEYAKQQRHIGQSCKVPPEDMVEIMERLLNAGNSQVIPDGYVMVPKEPTKQMILAGQEELESCIDNGFDSDIDGNRYDYTDIVPDAPHRVFMAMLAAAPQEVKGE